MVRIHYRPPYCVKKGAVALSHFGFVRQLSFFALFHLSILFFLAKRKKRYTKLTDHQVGKKRVPLLCI